MCSSGAISTENIKQVELLHQPNAVLRCCFGIGSLKGGEQQTSSHPSRHETFYKIYINVTEIHQV